MHFIMIYVYPFFIFVNFNLILFSVSIYFDLMYDSLPWIISEWHKSRIQKYFSFRLQFVLMSLISSKISLIFYALFCIWICHHWVVDYLCLYSRSLSCSTRLHWFVRLSRDGGLRNNISKFVIILCLFYAF